MFECVPVGRGTGNALKSTRQGSRTESLRRIFTGLVVLNTARKVRQATREQVVKRKGKEGGNKAIAREGVCARLEAEVLVRPSELASPFGQSRNEFYFIILRAPFPGSRALAPVGSTSILLSNSGSSFSNVFVNFRFYFINVQSILR
jgi:hypothetical protein